MPSHDRQGLTNRRWRRLAAARPGALVAAVVLLLAGSAAGAVGVATRTGLPAAARWQAGAVPDSASSSAASVSPSTPPRTVTMSATGDIVLGNAPGRLPPAGGKGFFAAVRGALAADLVMGNLEEPLTDETGVVKCRPPASAPPGSAPPRSAPPGSAPPGSAPPPGSPPAGLAPPTPVSPPRAARPAAPPALPAPPKPSGCHQFRAPPGYAAHLREGGFHLLNQANNHANDHGRVGYRNTRAALEKHGLRHTGAPDEITVVTAAGVRIAVVGFSAYSWSNSLTDIGGAKRVVRQAAAQADLVVVQVHMGAEGAAKTHVSPGTEMFLGENRGDPVKFSHAVVDAGADLVVGHGPHVMRAMEFYQGRLIAYSLGNFAGGGRTLSRAGPLGLGAVLRVTLQPDGGWAAGQLVATAMNDAGLPEPDPGHRGVALVRDLCREDFPGTGARLGPTGVLTPPAA